MVVTEEAEAAIVEGEAARRVKVGAVIEEEVVVTKEEEATTKEEEVVIREEVATMTVAFTHCSLEAEAETEEEEVFAIAAITSDSLGIF